MKLALRIVGGLLALLLLVGAGGYVYAGMAAEERLAAKFAVEGKDIPIPFPLSESEIESLRRERRGASAAKAAAAAPAPTEGSEAAPAEAAAAPAAEAAAAPEPAAAPAADAAAAGTDAAAALAAPTAPAAPAAEADPLAGVDLEAIALRRAIARGKALVNGRLPCGECHGADGGGKLVVDAQPVWTWYAPNITRGGKTKDYTARDWDRIIRHGVKLDGTPATMPSIDFMQLSDQEVSDLAAYFRSLPPIEAQQPPTVLGPVGKALIGFGKMPLSAEEIDHDMDHLRYPPAPKVDAKFGGHVAATCAGCHRTDFSGGPIAQGPPDWPPARNLTPHESGLKGWTEADFIRVLREGKRPDGTAVREPMAMMTKFPITDTEIRAMFVYLQQLPPTPTGQ